MSIAAVICEFNPFHNGHKYLLSQIRAKGYDTIICVMSSSFTQRGEVALLDKFVRTQVALKNGADLVVELPLPWSVSSAERFAKGGVEIIKALSVADTVFFGSESGNIELIKKAALATEDERVKSLLTDFMEKGDYYPLALEKSVEAVFGEEISSVLKTPNNTLGVEYMKELTKYSIKADTIKRTGTEHDSDLTCDEFASASFIRNALKTSGDFSDFVPDFNDETFENPAFEELGNRAVLLKLKTMTKEELINTADVTEGLENRIAEAAKTAQTIEELLSMIKTKRYTMARLRRIIMSAFLGITKDIQSKPVPYLRFLGMTEKGSVALSLAAKKASLPIVTNVAPALNNLQGHALETLNLEIKATDTRTIFEKNISPCGKDFTAGIIKA